MNPQKTMALFQHMSEYASCPKCSASFFPENLSVELSLEDSILIRVHCPSCREISQAHVFATIMQHNTADTSALTLHEPVSPEEVHTAHELLSTYTGGISGLFFSEKQK